MKTVAALTSETANGHDDFDDGQMLTPTLAISLSMKAAYTDRECAIEQARVSSLAAATLRYERALHVAGVRQLARERDAYEKVALYWRTEAVHRRARLLSVIQVAACTALLFALCVGCALLTA